MIPSHTILHQAQQPIHAVDATGRRLVLRHPTALDTLRLLKAAGPVLAQNEPWLGMAALAFCVVEIDGLPVPAPATEAQIEALVDRLGEHGLAAVSKALNSTEAESASEADVGNLPGTRS
ncbi:MAG TPA: hypothetical protein PLD10_21585 [Rhodopila sp.]|nr:hypothetical protein [Rhodopila sp.]